MVYLILPKQHTICKWNWKLQLQINNHLSTLQVVCFAWFISSLPIESKLILLSSATAIAGKDTGMSLLRDIISTRILVGRTGQFCMHSVIIALKHAQMYG